MTTSEPCAYEIRVSGHLDDHWGASLSGLTVTRNADGTSSVAGAMPDQAQLHGILSALRDTGAVLLRLDRTEPACPDPEKAVPPVLAQPLRTERLTLRAARPADADATWHYRQLPEVNEWVYGCPTDLDGYRREFREAPRLARTVVAQLGHDADSPVIGDFMLRREDAWAQRQVVDQARSAQAEIGWVIDPAHAGWGYATEAARELLRHAFEDLGLHRVFAITFLDNEASWRLMERMGMRREAHAVRESLHRSGRWLDAVTYALLADEWAQP